MCVVHVVKECDMYVCVVHVVKECDRLSVVTYDTYVNLVFGLMKMNHDNKDKARAFVNSIQVGSSTNLCGGLLKGQPYTYRLTSPKV